MASKKPTIDNYLLSTGLFIIDEFNEKYKNLSKEELRKIANNTYNEMDITVKLGYPFGQNIRYTVGDTDKERLEKSNHDLYVESKDFKIEVKYLKNWKCSSKNTQSTSKNWAEFQKDFDWVIHEIDNGNKGKRAFVIAWFNCYDTIAPFMQLGQGRGSKPLVNEERFCYFPFLKKNKIPTYTIDLVNNYNVAYEKSFLNLVGIDTRCECLFLGNEEDVFHIAIYC